MKIVSVAATRPYDIHIGENLIKNQTVMDSIQAYSRVAIIADEHLANRYAAQLSQDIKCPLLTFHANEQNKTRATKSQLEDAMLSHGLGRDSLLLAFGGGITLDIVGFVAATFCRGIPVIYFPTSLLAMIDACIGGKTGINTPKGKNLIGCFKQPHAVFCDLTTLTTLPQNEFKNGLAESIKHALLFDHAFFYWHVDNISAILNNDPATISQLVYKNCQLKSNIIHQDELENGKRQLLNFGHTLGHALEKASDFQLRHGEAVILGIIAANYIAQAKNILSKSTADMILSMLKLLAIVPTLSIKDCHFSAKINQHLAYDKKIKKDNINFILLKDIGVYYQNNNHYSHPIDVTLIAETIDWLLTEFNEN